MDAVVVEGVLVEVNDRSRRDIDVMECGVSAGLASRQPAGQRMPSVQYCSLFSQYTDSIRYGTIVGLWLDNR